MTATRSGPVHPISTSPPPNIVFILMDDLGWRDLGVYGSGFYETPTLDRLATQGMRFTDAYAACPVCSPTRASILTGKYPARVGVTNWIGGRADGQLIDAAYTDHLPLEEISLARALQQGGFQTWHVGKWHLGQRPFYPEHHGFDVNVGGCAQGSPPSYFSPYRIEALPDGPPGEYLTDRITDEAIALIEHRDDRPFFLNLCHYAVHTPIQAPADLIEKYTRKARRLGFDRLDPMQVGEPFPTLHKRDQRITRRRFQSNPAYAAMIENLDSNIGRLLQTLESQGIAKSTIVIFTSDNGGLATSESSPTCNAPLSEGKGWMYDGGVREPLIMRWPDITRPGAICSVPVTSPDFYPTLLEAAGLPLLPHQHQDGLSLLPLLRGESSLPREAIFWHYPHYGNQGGTPGCSVRSGDWKLIEFFEDSRVELYNLREDITESTNLAESLPDLAAGLQRRLREWQHAVSARMPEPNPHWPPSDGSP